MYNVKILDHQHICVFPPSPSLIFFLFVVKVRIDGDRNDICRTGMMAHCTCMKFCFTNDTDANNLNKNIYKQFNM